MVVDVVLLHVLHELPLIGEGAVVVSCKLFQHRTSGLADAKRVLEQIDERLGRQRRAVAAAGQGWTKQARSRMRKARRAVTRLPLNA